MSWNGLENLMFGKKINNDVATYVSPIVTDQSKIKITMQGHVGFVGSHFLKSHYHADSLAVFFVP